MSDTRSPSPRIPPPLHPTIRRQNVSSSPQLLGAVTPPVLDTAARELPTLSSRPQAPSDVSAPSTPTNTAPQSSAQQPLVLDEEEMSEAQLRQLYDEEEIDRFLRLFSDYIREVKVGQIPQSVGKTTLDAAVAVGVSEDSDGEGASWIPLDHGVSLGSPLDPSKPSTTQPEGLAEWVASSIMPYIPPSAPPPPPFTVRGLRLLMHRALLIIFHTYIPLISWAVQLASWKNPKTSLRYCILYWFLWYHDLLLPGMIVRIAYSLMRRKYLPYPNLRELREIRREQERADDLTKQVITRLAFTPAEHVKDLWNTFKEYRSTRKKETSGSATPDSRGDVPEIVVEDTTLKKDMDVLSEDDVLVSENNLYGPIFDIANKLADLHERVRNLFLWRRPQVSTIFAFVLLGMFFFSLIPVYYLAKLVGFSIGVLFWHVIPVVAAMPRSLPPPLGFAPTDAEYAMDLISQRVALGLPVQPKSRKRGKSSASASGSRLNINSTDDPRGGNTGSGGSSDSDVDWDKWTGRISDAKIWSSAVKESLKDGTWKDPRSWLPKPKLTPTNHTDSVPTYTYPGQCKAPGLITLTDEQLFFTPLTSMAPTLTVQLKKLTGVKRSGLAKGLKVRWTEVQDDGKVTEQEERFLWVANRDDLFARLVGGQSRPWLHA